MSGEVVAWAATDETGRIVEALGLNQSRRFDTGLVLAIDYAELQAKLDAVTKDAEALSADIREIYEQIPQLPITPETMDAATDVLTKFCIDFNAAITGSDHE